MKRIGINSIPFLSFRFLSFSSFALLQYVKEINFYSILSFLMSTRRCPSHHHVQKSCRIVGLSCLCARFLRRNLNARFSIDEEQQSEKPELGKVMAPQHRFCLWISSSVSSHECQQCKSFHCQYSCCKAREFLQSPTIQPMCAVLSGTHAKLNTVAALQNMFACAEANHKRKPLLLILEIGRAHV